MARVWTEGFEMGDLRGFDSIAYNPSAYSPFKRSGTYSMRCVSPASATKYITAITEGYIRFGFRWYDPTPGNISTLHLRDASGTIHLYIRTGATPGRFELRHGDGTLLGTTASTIALGEWYLFEVHWLIDDASGVAQMKVDGILEVDFDGDTKNSATASVGRVYFGPGSNTAYYDDIAVNDTTGAVDNSWCGDGHIIALTPDGNGDVTEWTGSDADASDNYLLIDDIPADDDTTYTYESTVDQRDLYALAASGLSGVTINRVWPEARARKTVADGTQIALVTKTTATEYDSADLDVGTDYSTRVIGAEYTANPNTTNPWSIAELDALQVGPKVRS